MNSVVVTGVVIQLTHLQDVGITHIVCIKHPGKDVFIRANFPEHFRYLLSYVYYTEAVFLYHN